MNSNAHALEGLWDVIPRSHDITHLKATSYLDVDTYQLVRGRLVVVIRTQARVAYRLPTPGLRMALVAGHRSYGVGGRPEILWGYGKGQGLLVISRKGGRLRI